MSSGSETLSRTSLRAISLPSSARFCSVFTAASVVSACTSSGLRRNISLHSASASSHLSAIIMHMAM